MHVLLLTLTIWSSSKKFRYTIQIKYSVFKKPKMNIADRKLCPTENAFKIYSKQKHLQIDFLSHERHFPGRNKDLQLSKRPMVSKCFSKTANWTTSIYVYAIIQLLRWSINKEVNFYLLFHWNMSNSFFINECYAKK